MSAMRCGVSVAAPQTRGTCPLPALSQGVDRAAPQCRSAYHCGGFCRVVGAAVFPFLTIDAAGNKNAVSILDAALAFSGGPMVALSLATAALIIIFPLLRVLLTLYVLIPVVLDRPPAPHAIRAFRLSEAMRPWSMAEIFAIGCAVALVKVADLAQVGFGPAFWMFGILVVLVIAQDSFLCKWSVWNSLEHPKRS
jgi:paraquat-inducible protein A